MSDKADLIQAVQQGDLAEAAIVLAANAKLATQKDAGGATSLHYAAIHGHREIALLLLEKGAEGNARDDRFGATPAGWAIEYLRERGGFLAIELDDLAYAVRSGDMHWVSRFLVRFPSLRQASDTHGTPFESLARESANPEIVRLFAAEPKQSSPEGPQ